LFQISEQFSGWQVFFSPKTISNEFGFNQRNSAELDFQVIIACLGIWSCEELDVEVMQRTTEKLWAGIKCRLIVGNCSLCKLKGSSRPMDVGVITQGHF
jgi:hypothetical protein